MPKLYSLVRKVNRGERYGKTVVISFAILRLNLFYQGLLLQGVCQDQRRRDGHGPIGALRIHLSQRSDWRRYSQTEVHARTNVAVANFAY